MNRRDFLQCMLANTVVSGAHLWRIPLSTAALEPVNESCVEIGMNVHMLDAHWLDVIEDLGIRRLRCTIYWPLWNENADYRRTLDYQIKQLHDRGMSLLTVLHNWVGSTNVFHSRVDQEKWEAFADWAAALVRQFPQVEGWQLWNEQEVWVQAPFGAGSRPRLSPELTGRNYAKQLALAYPRIKEASPETLVVTGGLATTDHRGRWNGFLLGMVEAAPPFDVVTIHAYGLWDIVRRRLQAARKMVGPDKPLWLTEFGNDQMGDSFTETHHLETWRTSIEGNMRERLARRVYPYCLQTDPRYPYHGLYRADGEKRPTYDWLKNYISNVVAPETQDSGRALRGPPPPDTRFAGHTKNYEA